MPANTVKVDRTTRWGNPFKVGDPVGDEISIDYRLSASHAVREYEFWLQGKPTVFTPRDRVPPTISDILTLRGKNLACWCKQGDFCHADVLLKLANHQ